MYECKCAKSNVWDRISRPLNISIWQVQGLVSSGNSPQTAQSLVLLKSIEITKKHCAVWSLVVTEWMTSIVVTGLTEGWILTIAKRSVGISCFPWWQKGDTFLSISYIWSRLSSLISSFLLGVLCVLFLISTGMFIVLLTMLVSFIAISWSLVLTIQMWNRCTMVVLLYDSIQKPDVCLVASY